MTIPWYTTRERVKRALDVKVTARNDVLIDDAVAAASRSVDEMMHRRFYPETATRYFDWPNEGYSPTWRFWLDGPELVSVSSINSGGTILTSNEYDLRRGDDIGEPPYNRVEINLGTDGFFDIGDTHQRDIAITGVWGYTLDEKQYETIIEDLDATETEVRFHDSAHIGVGSVVRVGSERMIVTDRDALTSGGGITADLAATNSAETVGVDNTNHFHIGETILVDSERMLVVDIAGTNLTVKRAWDGSTLAAHTNGATVYRYNSYTVERGALGTTATTHTNGDAAYVWQPPALIAQLTLAEAINDILQQTAGYARTTGNGDTTIEVNARGLADLRDRAVTAHGRQIRLGAV